MNHSWYVWLAYVFTFAILCGEVFTLIRRRRVVRRFNNHDGDSRQ